MKKYVHGFDSTLIRLIIRLPDWVKPVMQLGTILGQPVVTVGIAMSVIGYGIAMDNRLLVELGIIAIGVIVLTSVLKLTLRRPRPENDYVKTMLVQTFSFPSGHAAGSVVGFGLLAYVMGLPAWFAAILAFVCFVIGVSRVYLGAHYPTDVIGGWLLGLAGILVIINIGA